MRQRLAHGHRAPAGEVAGRAGSAGEVAGPSGVDGWGGGAGSHTLTGPALAHGGRAPTPRAVVSSVGVRWLCANGATFANTTTPWLDPQIRAKKMMYPPKIQKIPLVTCAKILVRSLCCNTHMPCWLRRQWCKRLIVQMSTLFVSHSNPFLKWENIPAFIKANTRVFTESTRLGTLASRKAKYYTILLQRTKKLTKPTRTENRQASNQPDD